MTVSNSRNFDRDPVPKNSLSKIGPSVDVAPRRIRGSLVRGVMFGPRANFAILVVSGLFLNMLLEAASAMTQVHGEQDDLQISAQNASINEVLDALCTKFKLTYKLPPGFDRKVTGLYSGSLHRTLARILDGNDYFLEVSDGGVNVVVLSQSSTIATAPANLAAEASENTLANLAPSKSAVGPTPVPSSSNSSPPPLSTYLSAAAPSAAAQNQ